MIVPQPMSLDMFRAKAADFDGFYATLRDRLKGAGALHGE